MPEMCGPGHHRAGQYGQAMHQEGKPNSVPVYTVYSFELHIHYRSEIWGQFLKKKKKIINYLQG